MTESVDRQTAVLRLRGADDILILCHKNPDGDTIGCAGAWYAKRLYVFHKLKAV